MNNIAGVSYEAARFDKDGAALNQQDVRLPQGTTDVIVASHGWNNTEEQAEQQLYIPLFTNFAAIASDQLQNKKIAIVGVIWPSKKFTDVVAPGEKILSAATGKLLIDRAEGKQCEYVEDSGTSMAAPHVSGVIAAFLSVRREFIGEPERVKEIFLGAATDLKRERSFQGAGLIDLMRAIQSV